MKERKSFPLRLDPGLYREIEAWAADDLRSVNAQIEFLLADAVRQRRKKMDDTSNRSDSEKTK
jgi:hypothetical protein